MGARYFSPPLGCYAGVNDFFGFSILGVPSASDAADWRPDNMVLQLRLRDPLVQALARG